MDATSHENTGRSGSSPSLSKRSGKVLAVRVQMLDDTITMFQIQVINDDKVLIFPTVFPRPQNSVDCMYSTHFVCLCVFVLVWVRQEKEMTEEVGGQGPTLRPRGGICSFPTSIFFCVYIIFLSFSLFPFFLSFPHELSRLLVRAHDRPCMSMRESV